MAPAGKLREPDFVRAIILCAGTAAAALLIESSAPDAFGGVQALNVTIRPPEDTNAVLHNPDMGWVLYENYPLDQDPHGSSTMLALPEETFPAADAIALMFEWRDVETSEGVCDFSKIDKAYDYWSARGKEIQLRMSSEPLLVGPNGSAGVPQYVLGRLKDSEKQTRFCEHSPYTIVDVRNSFYQQRLKEFLAAVERHFDRNTRPATLIDLRGFGLWGEWHSGFKYPDLKTRRAALKRILDIWTTAFPDHALLLSYSYDPDSPASYYAGPNNRLDPAFTNTYPAFLNYSAFDIALRYKNVAFRRDGCGGAVHSNERKLNEEAFYSFHKGPFFSEFLGGYGAAKQAGSNWVNWMVADALSLHPNYINLLGWQSQDALAFIRERPDLINKGAREMGYRFVPIELAFPPEVSRNQKLEITSTWINRGVGRALRDYELQFALMAPNRTVHLAESSVAAGTSTWLKDQRYSLKHRTRFPGVSAGYYELALRMHDPQSGRFIQLPLVAPPIEGFYPVGTVRLN